MNILTTAALIVASTGSAYVGTNYVVESRIDDVISKLNASYPQLTISYEDYDLRLGPNLIDLDLEGVTLSFNPDNLADIPNIEKITEIEIYMKSISYRNCDFADFEVPDRCDIEFSGLTLQTEDSELVKALDQAYKYLDGKLNIDGKYSFIFDETNNQTFVNEVSYNVNNGLLLADFSAEVSGLSKDDLKNFNNLPLESDDLKGLIKPLNKAVIRNLSYRIESDQLFNVGLAEIFESAFNKESKVANIEESQYLDGQVRQKMMDSYLAIFALQGDSPIKSLTEPLGQESFKGFIQDPRSIELSFQSEYPISEIKERLKEESFLDFTDLRLVLNDDDLSLEFLRGLGKFVVM